MFSREIKDDAKILCLQIQSQSFFGYLSLFEACIHACILDSK